MSDVMNVLTRKTSLRKACKELQLDDMERLAEMLAELISERQEEQEAELAAQQELQSKLDAARKHLAEMGLAPEDLIVAEPEQKAQKPRGKVKPKYQITDASGQVHQWTGRGRTPKVFQEFLDKGGNRDDLLI